VTRLADLFAVRRRFFRSVHLATDAQRPDASEGYLLTPLGKATLGRVLDGLANGRTERAWTLTGPYGVGKSAFVVMLAQLLCAGSAAATTAALRELHASDRPLERRFQQLRGAHIGLCPVLVSGTYGPLLPSLLDAAERSIKEMFRANARQQSLLRELHSLRASRGKVTELHRRVVKLFGDLAEYVCQQRGGGVLLVIDELGKCLEYAARGPERADEVFLLQELAEAASRSGSRPVVLITLLHQAFDRYAKDLAAETRAEWVKVQGRFADVAFLDAPGELLRLAARSIQRREGLPAQRYRAYDALAIEAVSMGLVPADQQSTLRHLAPLHPTVALLLPSLCRGPLAQNERSLFGFLTSTADGAFGAFLDAAVEGRDAAPTYTLDLLYDFIAATLGPAQYTHAAGRRWAAIDEAIARLPAGEPALSAMIIKSVGLLGLLGSRSVRASRELLCFALRPRAGSEGAIDEALERLTASSQVVFRRHSDAFALWEGSDIDLDAHFDDARRKSPGVEEIASLLGERMVLRPWVARRHFIETGTLRYFDVTLGTPAGAASSAEAALDGADGRIVYLLPDGGESHDDLLRAATGAARRTELVFGVPREGRALLTGVHDWCAWESVRSNVGALASDPVARRELSARIHFATDRLDAAVQSCFGLVDGSRVAWVHDGAATAWSGARALSSALSAVCDQSFSEAPLVRNELLNRRSLSSAAAAARRSLLDAMIAQGDVARLGIEGTPPEYSMYASLLAAGGLHRERDGRWGFGPPPAKDALRLAPAWRRIEGFLDGTEVEARPLRSLFDELAQRPIGLREGPMPVLFFAVVLSTPGEVALFEDGSFVPEITGAVVERLLRRIDHFAVARYRLDAGRLTVLRALWAALGLDEEAGKPIELTRAVVRRVSQLPRYSRGTRSVGATAIAARDVVLAARDPLRLLFRELPEALGLAPIERGVEGGVEGDAAVAGSEYAARLAAVLRELAGAHPALLVSIERRIADRLGVAGEGQAFRDELTARARRVVGLAVDLRLKAFLGRALEPQARHHEWLEGVAMVVGNRPPAEWTDGEITRFEVGLEEVRALFLRAEDLVGGGAEARREQPWRPEQLREIEGAEREILRMLEGRFGGEKEVWLAALSRTLNTLREPAGGSEHGATEGEMR